MEDSMKDNTGTNLADLAGKLAEAKQAIPISLEKLKDKPKSAESYLICKDGTIAETGHSEHENSRVVISETKK